MKTTLLTLCSIFVLATTASAQVLINEVDADTSGTDMLEFVELYDGGAGSTALDGLALVFYNGSSDTSYLALDLDGRSTDVNGFFIVGNAAVTGVDLTIPDNSIQNGADAIALYSADATDFPSGTAVTATSIVDAIVYDTNDADDTGLLGVLTPGQAQLNEDGNLSKDTDSNQRFPDGVGGPLNTGSWTQATATPKVANLPVELSEFRIE